jgi:hypothetical protein
MGLPVNSINGLNFIIPVNDYCEDSILDIKTHF